VVGEPSSPAGLTRFLPRAPAAHPSHPVPARAVCMPACCRPAACTLPSAPRRTIARQVDSLRNARRARCPAAHGLQEQERRFWMMSFIFSCRTKLAQRYTPIGYSQLTGPRSPLRRDVGKLPGSSSTSPTMSCQPLRQRSGRAWFSPCARSAHGSWFSSPVSRRCCAHPVRQRTEGKWKRCWEGNGV
jgi:hypothetical protein